MVAWIQDECCVLEFVHHGINAASVIGVRGGLVRQEVDYSA